MAALQSLYSALPVNTGLKVRLLILHPSKATPDASTHPSKETANALQQHINLGFNLYEKKDGAGIEGLNNDVEQPRKEKIKRLLDIKRTRADESELETELKMASLRDNPEYVAYPMFGEAQASNQG